MVAAKSSQTSDISPFIAYGNTTLIITESLRGFHQTLFNFKRVLLYKAPCRSKSLTVVPRLALTPRTPSLKHLVLYTPLHKHIITTVIIRALTKYRIVPPSSAIVHHAPKSHDSLFERNGKRSRKIATASCCAKKLETCHVKHFPLIITQAFRPSLPRRTRSRQGNQHERRPRPFYDPLLSAPSCHRRQSCFLTATITSGIRRQKTPRSCRKYE